MIRFAQRQIPNQFNEKIVDFRFDRLHIYK